MLRDSGISADFDASLFSLLQAVAAPSLSSESVQTGQTVRLSPASHRSRAVSELARLTPAVTDSVCLPAARLAMPFDSPSN